MACKAVLSRILPFLNSPTACWRNSLGTERSAPLGLTQKLTHRGKKQTPRAVLRGLLRPANVLDYCGGYSSPFIVSIISLKLFSPASMFSIISFAKTSGSGKLSRSVRLLSLIQNISKLVLSLSIISE